MRQNLARRPVHDGHQEDEAAPHRDIGDVGCPHLIRPLDRQISEQVRIHRMRRVRRAGVALAIDRRDAHLVHQRAHMLAAHHEAFQLEHVAQHAGTGEREVQVQLVDAPHQRQIRLRRRRAAGSTRSSAKGPATPPGDSPVDHEQIQSSLCARTVDTTERAGQKIILQRELADLRLHVLHARPYALSRFSPGVRNTSVAASNSCVFHCVI